ncbi:hypothetical protein PSHT_13652 [Puccinia striiformis]|uniref:Uncharacterized protein n=2 Tax=Puccinia striiformis TaxID=27350 RepID=A0A2S4VB22_9BASI|nr:hypothetical protein PSHT_13652 [Puccinia striiformis]POW06736.1 hypothetical protein PSTT_08731 [Puccinia striiformis]
MDSAGQVQVLVPGICHESDQPLPYSGIPQYLIICHPMTLNPSEAGPWLEYHGQVSPQLGSNPIIVNVSVATWRATPLNGDRPEFTGTITLSSVNRRITGTGLTEPSNAITQQQTPSLSFFFLHVDELFIDMYGPGFISRSTNMDCW